MNFYFLTNIIIICLYSQQDTNKVNESILNKKAWESTAACTTLGPRKTCTRTDRATTTHSYIHISEKCAQG